MRYRPTGRPFRSRPRRFLLEADLPPGSSSLGATAARGARCRPVPPAAPRPDPAVRPPSVPVRGVASVASDPLEPLVPLAPALEVAAPPWAVPAAGRDPPPPPRPRPPRRRRFFGAPVAPGAPVAASAVPCAVGTTGAGRVSPIFGFGGAGRAADGVPAAFDGARSRGGLLAPSLDTGAASIAPAVWSVVGSVMDEVLPPSRAELRRAWPRSPGACAACGIAH
jgi:hypothetical protein